MRIITEPKILIGRYVARMQEKPGLWGEFAAVALVNEYDEIVAGAVFNGYAPPNIFMHIAAERMTAGFIAALMHYAFVQAECKRITGIIEKKNRASRRFAEHLGAKVEGCMAKAAANGDDLVIYGLSMDRADKWLSPRYMEKLGKELTYG